MLFALAEQCIGEGRLKPLYFYLKKPRIGVWGPACLLSSLPFCLAFGTSRPVGGGNSKTTIPPRVLIIAAHILSGASSVPHPTCILSVIPRHILLAASVVRSVFSPILQIRKWSQRGEVICTRSHSFQVAQPEGVNPHQSCTLSPTLYGPHPWLHRGWGPASL